MNADALIVPVAAFLPRSRANGPGARSVLWVQGCPLRCPGCFNPKFQPFSGGQAAPAATVVHWIVASDETEGVTFSGGEPFAHAETLAAVAEQVRQAGKSVLVFSGYTKEALLSSGDSGHRRLLASIDVLIAGPFQQQHPSQRPWLASENQELVLLTNRYSREEMAAGRRRVEYRIGPDGRITVTGFPASNVAGTSGSPEEK